MGRVFTMVIMSIALTVLLYAAGITTDSGSFSTIFMNQIFSGADIEQTDLWVKITAALVTMGVIVGASTFIGNSGAGIAVANGIFAVYLMNFLMDFVYVITKARTYCGADSVLCADWVYWLIAIIFIPLLGGMTVALYEWVTGND